MKLTFEVETEQSRLPSPMWVGLMQSTEGLNRTKGRVMENSLSLPDCHLSWDIILSFLWIHTGTCTSSSLGSQSLHSDWNYTIHFPGSPVCPLQILGLGSLHNHLK